jgi:hypothetical protein
MVRRVAGLAKAPRVTLPEGLVSEYRLRKRRPTGGMCHLRSDQRSPVPAGGSAPPRAPCSRAQPFRRALTLVPGVAPRRKSYGRHLGECFQFRSDISRGIPAGSLCAVRKGRCPKPRTPGDRPEPPRQRDD